MASKVTRRAKAPARLKSELPPSARRRAGSARRARAVVALIEDYVELIADLLATNGEARRPTSPPARRLARDRDQAISRVKRDGMATARLSRRLPHPAASSSRRGCGAPPSGGRRAARLGVPAERRSRRRGIEHHVSDASLKAFTQFLQARRSTGKTPARRRSSCAILCAMVADTTCARSTPYSGGWITLRVALPGTRSGVLDEFAPADIGGQCLSHDGSTGIDAAGGVIDQFGLAFACAVRTCEACQDVARAPNGLRTRNRHAGFPLLPEREPAVRTDVQCSACRHADRPAAATLVAAAATAGWRGGHRHPGADAGRGGAC